MMVQLSIKTREDLRKARAAADAVKGFQARAESQSTTQFQPILRRLIAS